MQYIYLEIINEIVIKYAIICKKKTIKKKMKDSTNKKLRIGKLNKIFMKKIIKTT